MGFIALLVVLYLGWSLPTERYISPTRGVGYALGIIGGSLMLVLLLYSARKHFRWLRFLGPTPAWFRFHMVLGIAGPLCILFHSNFSTGAANSNVALFSMLTVAGSGFIGRYLYAHIHHGLYGRKLELGDLQASASGLREHSGGVSFLPDLVTRLEVAERHLLACGPQLSLLGFLKPLVVRLASVKARWQLHRYTRRGLRASARKSAVVASESKRLRRTANAYIDRRLAATRRVAEFQGFERLFSLWHALHIPLNLHADHRRGRSCDRGERLLTLHRHMWGGRCRLLLIPGLLCALVAAREADAVNPETLLMPGKLTAAHAKFEEECAKCHDRSDRSRQTGLCLDCHKETATDVRQHRGFHGRLTGIDSTECRACHSEHLGRNGDIVKFSREQFNHDQTDYPLKGAHVSVPCASCHVSCQPYRKAPSDCLGCHKKE